MVGTTTIDLPTAARCQMSDFTTCQGVLCRNIQDKLTLKRCMCFQLLLCVYIHISLFMVYGVMESRANLCW
jgi:hypothetical protein